MKHWFPWLCLALLVYGGWNWFDARRVYRTSGMLVAEAPQQSSERSPAFEVKGFRVSPLAQYELRARVLGIESYRFDAGAAISPIDFAVGWGPMSDTAVLDTLNVTQGNRWYYFRTKPGVSLPLPVDVMSRHSANMHLIPANSEVDARLKSVRIGHVVALKGRLVEVRRADGWRWVSSVSRDDTGVGSCELMYVESIDIE